ncbi:BA75_00297T0 [Komagataella pastoris]|uniref:BA75_00297T0 n=1 Tax=Komagataella pastoris TaxID=4922 RepID=A0A1B2J5A9_PICPA|nr:BA75_00297T0 [Komagataella pastoris]
MTEFILNQGFGYGIALGLGAAFALLMMATTYTAKKFLGQKQDSERFTTASRSVKQGLISSCVVSSWTWPGTLLTSSQWAYQYGVVGSYWYAAMGSFQVLLFTLVAIEIKKRCPGIHTIAEVARVRFGRGGHLVYLSYCLGTNVIVSCMLLLGGSQGFSFSTGMHIVAACFLLPMGVCVYTLFGGLQATFLSDWTHTVIIYVIILVCLTTVYGTSDLIGSPGKMYDLLTEIAKESPSSAANGSYLTFDNRAMIFTAWNLLMGGASTVFGDPSYSQKAIAASAKDVMFGYITGGLCWQIIPWGLGTCTGLAALALTNNPASYTYPNALTVEEAEKGLPLVYGMAAIFGKSGAASAVVMIFMSVTSAMSAELISCSSILTYDFYRSYVNPKASGKQLVTASHISVIGFSIFMGGLAVVFNYIGVTIGWILNFIGIALGPVLGALLGMLFYPKMTKYAMWFGPTMATLTGVACWLGSCHHFYGELNKDNLAGNYPSAIGNFVSVFSSPLYIFLISLIKPQSFDLATLNEQFEAGDDAEETELERMKVKEEDLDQLNKSLIQTRIFLIIHASIFVFILPLSLYGSGYIFSKRFFTAWVVITIIWEYLAAMWIIIWPLYESRVTLRYVIMKLLGKEVDHHYYGAGEVKEISTSDQSFATPSVAEAKNEHHVNVITDSDHDM